MFRLVALAALLALALTGTAHAAAGDLAGLYVGQTVWGAPACGQPRLEVSTPGEYEAEHGTGVFDSGEPLAWADDTRCAIVINRTLSRLSIRTAVKRCHVIVHEWGHLAGREHSRNPRSVMFDEDVVSEGRERVGRSKRYRWVADGAFRPCYEAAAPGFEIG